MQSSAKSPSPNSFRRGLPWLFGAIAFIYLYFIPYFQVLNNPNENARVYQIRAAVELHKLSVNEQIARYGMVNDLARVGSRLYSGKAPGMNMHGIPVYAALSAFEKARGAQGVTPFRLLYTLRFFCVLVPVLFFLIAFRRFLYRFTHSGKLADILTIVLATGTMLLPYSLLFVNHSLTAASAFGTIIAAQAHAEGSPQKAWKRGAYLFLAGFLLAFSTAADHALFPVSCLLFFYCAGRAGLALRPLAALCAGALIPTLATCVYNQLCWGHPLKTSIGFLANPEFAKNQSQGFFGLVGPSVISTYNILISPAKGLFFFSPIFLPAIAALLFACIRSQFRRIAILSCAITIWMIFFACSLTNWDAGWTVGPRYATVILPFGLFGIALAWKSLSDRAKRLFVPLGIVLSLISMVFSAMPSVLFPHLPPESQNPVFEVIWPLWRDGYVPHTLLEPLFLLRGRAAQLPFLMVFAFLLLQVLGKGISLLSLHSRAALSLMRKAAIGSALCALSGLFIYLASLPRTPNTQALKASLHWIENVVWEPKKH